MQVSVKTSGINNTGCFFIFKDDKQLNQLPKALRFHKQKIQKLIKDRVFTAKQKQSFFLPLQTKPGQACKYILLIGLGEKKHFDYEAIRQVSAKAYKELKSHQQDSATFFIDSFICPNTPDYSKICQASAEAAVLTSYTCLELKKSKKTSSLKLALFVPDSKKTLAQKACRQACILAESANFVKKLANYPGNLMTPSILAEEVLNKTKKTSIATSVWDKKRIQKERLGGLLGVSLGSSQEPRFIIMKYQGTSSSQKPIALVGKGLTFDSGGISLKPSARMDEMKFDMCGAVAVIGAMLAIERLKLKVNVTAFISSSENMPGQSANKPGDILTARNGKTMEILNTDAEGRIILADALSYASEQKPQVIFDAATLTGAVVVSLGNIYTGFFTKNKDLSSKIKQAGEITGEKLWQLPLSHEHSEDIKSTLADVANISSVGGAGSSTAAAFLENFVDKNIPWAHFDIAGTAWNVHNRLEYCSRNMASACMVRTFVELARSYE